MSTDSAKSWTPRSLIAAILGRGAVFTLLWAALSDGRFDEWPIVALSIGAAVAASLALWPARSWRWRPMGLFVFAPYFLWQSWLGGWDVARRALSPRMNLAPGVIEMDLRLSREPARVFFIWTVSLLPGTAGVGMDGAGVRIHALDTRTSSEERLRRLESAVARLFGEQIAPAPSP